MRLSRLRAVSAAVIPLVFLAACGSGKADTPANALDVITVGGTDTAPKVTFKTKPLSVKVTTTKVITAGKGAKLSKDNSILFNYVLFNGKDGKQIESSFGKQTAGAGPLVHIAAARAEQGPDRSADRDPVVGRDPAG